MAGVKATERSEGLGPSVRLADPDRYFCTLFAPARARESLFALYAFNHELARACEVARAPGLALIRLQWWREVVEGESKPHPVAQAVRQALACATNAGHRLLSADLLEMVEAREREAEGEFATVADWNAWLLLGAGSTMVAAGRALGAPEGDLARLRELGAGVGAAGCLRNVGAHAAQGRCLLPAEILANCGVTAEEVIGGAGVGAMAGVVDMVSVMVRAMLGAGQYFPRPWVAAGLPAVIARRYLSRPVGTAREGTARMAVLSAWLRGVC